MAKKLIKLRPYCRYSLDGKNARIRFYNSKKAVPPACRINHFHYKGFAVTIKKLPRYGLPYEYELRPHRHGVKYIFIKNHVDVFYDRTSWKYLKGECSAEDAAKEGINDLVSPMSFYFWDISCKQLQAKIVIAKDELARLKNESLLSLNQIRELSV